MLSKNIEINEQPKFVKDATDPTDPTKPGYGDKVDNEDLDGFKITVTYDEGGEESTEVFEFDGETGKWNKLDPADPSAKEELPGLPDDLSFTWDNGPETLTFPPADTSTFEMDPAPAPTKNTITVASVSDPTKKYTTTAISADPKAVTITPAGTYTRPYDGTDNVALDDAAPEITYTIADAEFIDPADKNLIKVVATPYFEDKNVNKVTDGDNVTYPKTIKFKNVSIEPIDDTPAAIAAAAKYTIKPDANGEDIAPINGAMTPKPVAVTIKDKGIVSNASETVTRTGVEYAAELAAEKYIVTTDDADLKALIAGEELKLSYTGKYATPVTAGTDKAVTVETLTAVDKDGNTDNYAITPTVTGDVTEYVAPRGGGGGGGGGSVNTLTIHYENEDGTAGDDVSKISVPLGTDPTDLIGVIKTKIKDMTVLWTSDNEEVATVDENGIVTYVGEGKATITAQSKQTKSLKDTVVVTVTAAEATPAPTEPTPTTPPRTHERVNDSLITKTMLNPYIVGYDDYVFGPELPISREELAAIFARLIANNLYMDQNYDTSFPDVPEKWSKSYIGYLEGFNVVTGYEDGNFRPENYITRAEMAVMMAKAEGYDITPDIDASEVDFPDVDEGYATWSAAKAIQILSDLGIMSGYTDGTFRPGQPITRAETVATVNRVLAAQEVADREVLPSDVTDAHWAYEDIVFAMNHRILKDTAADPNAFIWSEEFDKNMITTTERVEGEKEVIVEDTSSEEKSSDEDNSSSAQDATEAKTEETTAETGQTTTE